MILLILLVLGEVTFTICCDCHIENWRIKQCQSKGLKEPTLNLNYSLSLTENCNDFVVNVTTDNKLEKVHSFQLEVEGALNGVPLISFSDPSACKYNPGATFLRKAIPIFCSKLHGNFDMIIPIDEDDRHLLGSISGELYMKVWYRNINNVVGQTDCLECTFTVQCSEEDY